MQTQMPGEHGFKRIPLEEGSERSLGIGGMEGAAAAILIALVTGLFIGRCSRTFDLGQSTKSEDLLPGGKPLSQVPGSSSENEAPLALGEFWDATTTRFCPLCRAEYISGTSSCEDCGVELVDEDEVPEGEIEIQEGTVRVVRLANSFHGQLLREFLAANNIPCSMHRCSAWDIFGADIHVFESDALRAKRLIRHYLHEMDVGVA